MAVADIFTAITEDRPYRQGMSLEQASEVINSMVKDSSLCPYVVSILMNNMEILNETRKNAQQKSKATYDHIMEPVVA
jgi:HD-GYP domain-containing protein (c-di-GMP phosphodiesterase class II)